MRPYKDKKLAFIDGEMSGTNPLIHEILEIGVIIYDRENDTILKEYEAKILPAHIETAEKEALEINGYIKNASLYTKNINSVMIKVNKLIDSCILVGHTVNFDIDFLNKAMKDLNIKPKFDHRCIELKSMAWAYALTQNLNGLSLKDLCNHFNISNEGAHTALVDCRRGLAVYKCLVDIYNKGLDNL